LLFLIAEYGVIILKRNRNIAALSIEDLSNIIDELKEEDQKNMKKLNKKLEGKSLQTSYNETTCKNKLFLFLFINNPKKLFILTQTNLNYSTNLFSDVRENTDANADANENSHQVDNAVCVNPKPRSDWRKGDKTVFDKRRGSRSVSERKRDYRRNVSQKSHLANHIDSNNNKTNDNICYTEYSNSANNHNNNNSYADCHPINYPDMNLNNLHVQNTMPNKSHYENNYSEQNVRQRRKYSGVSKSQNLESNYFDLLKSSI